MASSSFFLASSLGELSNQDRCFQGVEVNKMALSSLRAERNSIQNFCVSRSPIQHVPRMTSQNSNGCVAGFGKDGLTWGVASANRCRNTPTGLDTRKQSAQDLPLLHCTDCMRNHQAVPHSGT